MENVIREGTLRLLESTCDVILSCQGRRLMAHKVMLSVASPVFRELLLDDLTAPTVIILPDIPSHIMSLLLDYIYTGNVIVYSNILQNFLSLAKLFKIQLDAEVLLHQKMQKVEERYLKNYKEIDIQTNQMKKFEDYCNKKTIKKLPQLIPINKVRNIGRAKVSRRTNSCVLPSPWRHKLETVYGNPRDDILENHDYLMTSYTKQTKMYENDSNNNFQLPILSRYYLQNRDTLVKAPEQYSPKKTTSTTNFFPNLYEKEKNSNGLLNNTISRPPEEVAVDRDKPKIDEKEKELDATNLIIGNDLILKNENEKSSDMKNWLTSKPSSNDPALKEDPVIKEESNNSNQEYECKSISAMENEQKCKTSDSEQNSDKEKPFKCDECGKTFSQLRNFKYHRSVHEGTKEFAAKCMECGKIFNDKGYLSSHMKIHRDKKEYACPHCPKRFNQRVAYNMHLRIHTGVKPHECPTCKKSFSRKMLLKQHQRVHTGERPYSCPECGKTFADRSNMSLHARLHTGVKPYACNLCPKSFTKKHHLKTHMNFHTGLKPYKCTKCGLAFSQSSNMRTHYKKCLLKYSVSENEPLLEENEENKDESL